MKVEAEDMTCALNHVTVTNLLSGKLVEHCEWADDEEGAYKELVMLPDGTPAVEGGDFVKRVVLAPISIAITPRSA